MVPPGGFAQSQQPFAPQQPHSRYGSLDLPLGPIHMPQLPPDIPPPHVFVQMLIANDLPVPPELQQFIIAQPRPQVLQQQAASSRLYNVQQQQQQYRQ